MKKFLSIVLLLCMCCTFYVPLNVFAETVASGECEENLTWTLDNSGTLTINGNGNMPWSHYSYGSSNAPWRSYATDVKKVIIKSGVKNISNVAFEGFVNLTTVTIPNSVTSIGLFAFNECSNLVDITVPNSVTSIGSGAFAECGKLVSITIPNGVTNIGSNAFYKCSNLKNIIIPDSVTSIDDAAFQQCSNLTNITIPNGITSIGSNAFYKCIGLTNITLPENVTNIRWSSFERCENLMNVTVFNTNATFGKDVFKNCSSSLVLQGYSGSTTEKYANENNITFKKIDKEETVPDNEVCSICGDEIINDNIFYDDDGNIICELCDNKHKEETISENENQSVELACPHCSEILEITEDEYNEREYIVCPDCMKFIIYDGEDIEYECFDCGEIFYYSETKLSENGKIYCPYCNEIVDSDNIETETECYICGEYFNEDELMWIDEDDNLICQDCYAELTNEDETLTYIECPYCEEVFEDNEDIYDVDGYAVCPYCEGLIDTSEVIPEETEIEFATSDWAAEEVYEAYQNNLIPEGMLEDTLYDTITREEFAAIAVKLYENIVGEAPYADIDDMPFTDCDYESKYLSYIAIAYELGITKGTSETTFSPYDNISREQLATMLYRVIKLAENDKINNFDVNNVRKFYDDSEIADYAKESVYFMAEYGIVKGVDGAHFAPLDTATKEQSILISVRCVNSLFEY